MTFQALHDYSDRETAEAVRFDVRWKAAIGRRWTGRGSIRPRGVLAAAGRSPAADRVNDPMKTVIEETGVLKGRRRRAVGSTILAEGAATQDTVTQLVSAIRRAGRRCPARRGDRGGVHRARLLEAGQAEGRLG